MIGQSDRLGSSLTLLTEAKCASSITGSERRRCARPSNKGRLKFLIHLIFQWVNSEELNGRCAFSPYMSHRNGLVTFLVEHRPSGRMFDSIVRTDQTGERSRFMAQQFLSLRENIQRSVRRASAERSLLL